MHQVVAMVDEFHRSGLSVAAFTARTGVSVPTVYHWKRLVGERRGFPAAGAPVPSARGRVVAAASPAPTVGDAGVSIVLPGGLACRVEPGFHEGARGVRVLLPKWSSFRRQAELP